MFIIYFISIALFLTGLLRGNNKLTNTGAALILIIFVIGLATNNFIMTIK